MPVQAITQLSTEQLQSFSVKPELTQSDSNSVVNIGDRLLTEFAQLKTEAANTQAKLGSIMQGPITPEKLFQFQTIAGNNEILARAVKAIGTRFTSGIETLCKS